MEETAERKRRPRPAAPAERIAEPETGVLEAVARAVAHVEERRTVIPASEIRALVLGHAPGRYRLDEIDATVERLVREGELRETVLRGSDRSFVTDRAVKAERCILKAVRQGRATTGTFASEEAVARAREGEAGEAMTRLANRVTEHRVEDLGREAAWAWLALGAQDRDACAVLAPTHAVRREINAMIREGLAGEGVLTGRTLMIECLVDRRHTVGGHPAAAVDSRARMIAWFREHVR